MLEQPQEWMRVLTHTAEKWARTARIAEERSGASKEVTPLADRVPIRQLGVAKAWPCGGSGGKETGAAGSSSSPIEDATGAATDCAICLVEYAVGDKVFELPCSHLFHEWCTRANQNPLQTEYPSRH